MKLTTGLVAAASGAVFAGVALSPGAALATNGYFSNGYGGPSKGSAGAGLTTGSNPLDLAQNPALGVNVGTIAGLCMTLFMPSRSVTIGNNGPAAPLSTGTYQSKNPIFPIVCGGYNAQLNDTTSLGLITFANGGMDVNYNAPLFGGKFGLTTANTAIDMGQQFVALELAHKVSDTVTLGIAPTLAIQRVKVSGLEMFEPMSQSPQDVTGNGYDWSYGGGVKAGILWEALPWLDVGAAYQSPMFMSKFSNYQGLFADSGAFNIPGTLSAGVGIKPMPGLTVMLEYERIFYGAQPAIANSGVPPFQGPLGSSNGPGFGWQNVNVYRLGVQWHATPDLTLRGGVSYGTAAISSASQVMFNILAPAVVQTHLSCGASYAFSSHWSGTISYMHAFENSLSGTAPAAFGGQPITLRMSQNEVAFGISYRF